MSTHSPDVQRVLIPTWNHGRSSSVGRSESPKGRGRSTAFLRPRRCEWEERPRRITPELDHLLIVKADRQRVSPWLARCRIRFDAKACLRRVRQTQSPDDDTESVGTRSNEHEHGRAEDERSSTHAASKNRRPGASSNARATPTKPRRAGPKLAANNATTHNTQNL